jgi:hypothetical protein
MFTGSTTLSICCVQLYIHAYMLHPVQAIHGPEADRDQEHEVATHGIGRGVFPSPLGLVGSVPFHAWRACCHRDASVSRPLL